MSPSFPLKSQENDDKGIKRNSTHNWHQCKEPACQCWRRKRCTFDPWVRKMPWRRAWQPTPVFLLGEPHGQRSLAGYTLYAQSCLTLSDPMDCSLPGPSIHGIFQAKVLEWGASAFSGSASKRSLNLLSMLERDSNRGLKPLWLPKHVLPKAYLLSVCMLSL